MKAGNSRFQKALRLRIYCFICHYVSALKFRATFKDQRIGHFGLFRSIPHAHRGGLRGAGGTSTVSKMAANIDRGFLTKKPLGRCRPVVPCEEKVVNRGEAFSLSRAIQPSQLMLPQRQITISPLDIGTRPLEHRRQPLRLVLELVLCGRPQVGQCPARLEQ